MIKEGPRPEQQDFKNPEIAEIAEALESLWKKILPEIQKLGYSAIISDDLSARVPSTVIWNLAKKIYSQNGLILPLFKIRGSKPLELSQTPSETKKSVQTEKDFFNIRQPLSELPKDKKVLLVTEYVESGTTIQNFISQLKKFDLVCDVASATVNKNYLTTNPGLKNSVLFSGKIVTQRPKIWSSYHLIGSDNLRETKISTIHPDLNHDINILTSRLEEGVS